MTSLPRPRLFISYSWSSPDHEQWVIDLATELNNSGVEVLLDKWDLREGHDANAFMERMVTDKTVTKVILVCDKVYADKADGRSGGVGTETQIISAEVYARKDQDKFVAVIAEKDDAGKAYVPTYYKSRIYIDLSESDRYAENFERLLRWVFDKPLHVRPEIGRPPAFILEENAPIMGTSAAAKRLIEGLKSDKPYVRGALDEYLSLFSEQIERFRIEFDGDNFDEKVVGSVEAFIPARNEFIQAASTLVQYSNLDFPVSLHRFFESLIPYYFPSPDVNTWNESSYDNFKFIVHELFLYVMALLLRAENFEAANYLLSQPYYVPRNQNYGKDPTATYTIFRDHLKTLEWRNQRLNARRISIRADMLEQRSKTSGIQFRHLMQADFVCYLRPYLTGAEWTQQWWPETLLYAMRQHGPFEIFARAASKRYLNRILPMLGVDSVDKIRAKLSNISQERILIPRWDYQEINPAGMLGLQNLGTKD